MEEDAQAQVEPSGAQDEGSGLLIIIAVRNGPWPKVSALLVLHESKSILWDEQEVVLPK